MTYHHPSRPAPLEYRAGLAWWRSLPQEERLDLYRRRGLETSVDIVGYWRRHCIPGPGVDIDAVHRKHLR